MRAIVMSSMAMMAGCSGDDAPASAPVDAMPDAFVCIQPVIRFADTGACGLASTCINIFSGEVFLPGISCNSSCDDFVESECVYPGKGCQAAYVYDEGADPSTLRFMQCWRLDNTYDSSCSGSNAYECMHRSSCSPVYLTNGVRRKFDRCIDRVITAGG